MTPRLRLILLIIVAFMLDYVPFINLPFLWSQTFFHEMSHGLAALISGGQIVNITLNYDGSGLCTTRGGVRFIVTFSGYAGSALWGVLLYRITGALSSTKAKFVAVAMIAMTVLTLLLWARNLSTIIILCILLITWLLPLYTSLRGVITYFIQLVAVFVILDAIRSPLYLLDGRDIGDGATLASLSWIPEIIWVAIWFTIALGSLLLLWKHSGKKINR